MGPALIGKLSVLPTRLSALCGSVQRVSESLGLAWKVVTQAVGLGVLRLEGRNAQPLPAALASLRGELSHLGGSLVVLHCPPEMKASVDVWGTGGDAQPLMLRVKEQLDPAGVLNPGRFVGGI
jgi:glycolate oxidase FAD binding subunit